MNSLKFPKMFEGNSVAVETNSLKATMQDTILLFGSEPGELFGDPFFGLHLKRFMFNQNNYVLRDILIDEIYTKLKVFAPQLDVDRNNIKIIQDGVKLKARFKAINKIDFTTNMYELVLLQEEER